MKHLGLWQIFIKYNIKDYKQEMETRDKKLSLENLCNQLDRKKKLKWRYYSLQCTKYEEEQGRYFLKLSEMLKDFSSARDEEK